MTELDARGLNAAALVYENGGHLRDVIRAYLEATRPEGEPATVQGRVVG